MANWILKNQLLCQPHLVGNLLFPDAKVFFANPARSTASKDGANKKTVSKENMGDFDELAMGTSTEIDQELHANTASKLEDQLRKLRAEDKISTSTFDQARRLANSQRYLDQELVRKLIKGDVSSPEFKKYASYLHPDTGDAADRHTMQKLAEQAIFGTIPAHIFDKAADALESKSLEHKQAVEALVEDPKKVKKFAEFMLKTPLKKTAPHDLPGVTALDMEQDRLGKTLAAYKRQEMNEYLAAKRDTPESAETLRGMVKEFEIESQSHNKHWNELTGLLNFQVAKGDKNVLAALEFAVGEAFPDVIHQNEKDISLADLNASLEEAGERSGIDLKALIPPETLKNIHQRVVHLQELSRKAAATKTKIEQEFEQRHEQVVQKQKYKMEVEHTARQSGINLTPGTKIRYRKTIESPNGAYVEHQWDETEIQGIYLETLEESAMDSTPAPKQVVPMVLVEGLGEFGADEFIKWTHDAEASQIISDTATLNKEIEFDIMDRSIREGSILEQKIMMPDGHSGQLLRKVEKISDDGFVELDHPIDLIPAGAAIKGVPSKEPIQKKRCTFGEFAAWVRRTDAKPHMKTTQEAEHSYNAWKKAKGYPTDVRFQKGQFLTFGPYEQKNLLFINDVRTDSATGEQFVTINNVEYRVGEVLNNAIAANWQPVDENAYATQATAHIENPMQRIEVFNRTIQNIRNQKTHLIDRLKNGADPTVMAAARTMGSMLPIEMSASASASASHALPDPKAHAEGSHGGDHSLKGGVGGGHGGGHGGGGDGHGGPPRGPHGEEIDPLHITKGGYPTEGKKEKKLDPSSSKNKELFEPILKTDVKERDPEKEHEEAEKKAKQIEDIKQGVYIPEPSELYNLWVDTHFLSMQEMWQLGKHIWEYWERTWERKMKGRFSKFGQHLPFIGTEMLRIKEETEHHEVGTFKEAISAMGIIEIRGILNRSSNADQIKACIEVLVDKGQMRWDDVRTWEAMNRIPNLAADKKIPIPKDRSPYTPVGIDEKTGARVMGMDLFGKAIDSIWGDALYEQWQSKNSGAYDSGMKGFSKQGDELEGDPYGTGKIAGKMRGILKTHMEGDWANPQEFEGLLRYIIGEGKSTAENKIFFLVAGVATRLISLERMSAISNDLQNKLPFLAFFADKGTKKPGQHAPGPYTVQELKLLCAQFIEDPGIIKDEQKYTAGPAVKDFLWKYMLPNGEVQTRTIKAIRNGETNIDHDDAQMVIPLLDDEWVQQVCSHAGGRKKYFTIPGYVNAYPGFAEWVKTLSGTYDPDEPDDFKNKAKLIQGIKSFVKYDGILSSRFKKGDENYQRLSRDYLEQPSVVDSNPVKHHRNQMHEVIRALGKEFNIADTGLLFEDTAENFKDITDQANKQKKIEGAYLTFGNQLQDAINSAGADGTRRMIRAIQNVELWGFGYDPDTEAQEKAKAQSMALESKAEEAEQEKAKPKH